MKEKKEKTQDGVVKVKPHVCKRSLTSASALYSFLTAAHIPAVVPPYGQGGGGGGCGGLPDSATPHQEQKVLAEGAACGVTLEFYS